MRGPSRGHGVVLALPLLPSLTLGPVCQHSYCEVDLSWMGAGC